MCVQYQFNQRLIAAARAQIPHTSPCPGFQYDARYAAAQAEQAAQSCKGRPRLIAWVLPTHLSTACGPGRGVSSQKPRGEDGEAQIGDKEVPLTLQRLPVCSL